MTDPLFYYFHPVPIIAAQVPCDQDLSRLIRTAYEVLTAVHAAYRSKHIQQRGLHGDGSSALTAWCLYAGSSRSSYSWMQRTGKELCNEYAFRYPLRERHPLEQAFHTGLISVLPPALTNAIPVEPPVNLVREFSHFSSAEFMFLSAYAFHLRGDATWTHRYPPFELYRQIAPHAWGLI
jgi:hypothetical protein